jgi:hypothetical protein
VHAVKTEIVALHKELETQMDSTQTKPLSEAAQQAKNRAIVKRNTALAARAKQERRKLAPQSVESTTLPVAAEAAPALDTFPLSALTSGSLPEGINPQHKERYLPEAGFMATMGLSRAQFGALPGWKQKALKRKARLF